MRDLGTFRAGCVCLAMQTKGKTVHEIEMDVDCSEFRADDYDLLCARKLFAVFEKGT